MLQAKIAPRIGPRTLKDKSRSCIRAARPRFTCRVAAPIPQAHAQKSPPRHALEAIIFWT